MTNAITSRVQLIDTPGKTIQSAICVAFVFCLKYQEAITVHQVTVFTVAQVACSIAVFARVE